jgi:tetratricopeptide (TPR) repeat protein
LIGMLGMVLAASPLSAATNAVGGTNASVTVPDPNDPVEKEYKKLMEDDDAAQAEVDQWIRDNDAAATKGAGVPSADLKRRVRDRFAPIGAAYVDFIRRHPDHARARVAYGSFLNDLQDEEGAQEQWEKALSLNPKDPAVYNNLANLYGHIGPVKKAFEYYAKAIELNPREPVYYHNFGTTVYLFRRDATNFFHITEAQVFDKAMALYRKALDLDPENFILATDLAQSYYGIKPPKTGDAEADRKAAQRLNEQAMAAWQVAMKLARDDIERQGVLIHFARFHINMGQFQEARSDLAGVTNGMFNNTKSNLTKKLTSQENKAKGNGAAPAAVEKSENTNPH